MLGNFKYMNPTKIYFGKDSINNLKDELNKYGKNIVLVYGMNSIKKNGIYDNVISILKECDKNITEISGVMPNPTLDKLYEGIKIARAAKADFLLAVGGGSVIDYTKALSASINLYDDDPWEKYFTRFEDATCEIVPLGSILTMCGTGSEMNTGSVITNTRIKQKNGQVFPNELLFPRFSILDPMYTMLLPKYQMVAGVYDAFNHIMEQYFSGSDDNTSDYLAEGLMRSLITSSKIAVVDPNNYEARSNIMWCTTLALNTLVGLGKEQDWMVHMIGQAIGAVTNATHGMTLSSISMSYYRYILPYGLDKFKRFAINVWNVNPYGKSDMDIAIEGLAKQEEWMKQIGLAMNISELGANKDNIDDIVKATLLGGGYKVLTKEEVREILVNSL